MTDPATGQLEALIYKRAKEGAAQRERKEVWKASARAYHERHRRRIRAQWFEFFSRMSESHRELLESYARRAEALCGEELAS